jgi:hypothetical protein
MARRWLELAREDGLATGISHEDGRASGTFHLTGPTENDFPTVADIRDAVDELLGGVNNLAPKTVAHTDPHGGKVRRRLPKCHPFLELPVAGVASITGYGKQQEVSPVAPLAYAAGARSYIQSQFTNYSCYKFGVEFRKRNYFLKADEFIGRERGTYYAPGTSTAIDIYFAREWERFTWRTFAPMGDTVSTEFGFAKFSVPGGDPLDGRQYLGNPYMHLLNQAVEITWYMVPLRYFFDYTDASTTYRSYLTRFVNTVNQNEWFGYAPGTLLFMGATPEPFVPSIPKNIKGIGGLSLATSEALLCNVKLRFLYTARTTDAPPDPTDLQLTSDRNNVAAGHNLQPTHDRRKFYYAVNYDANDKDNRTKFKPFFKSFPHELLFTDPLLIQPGGPI